MPVLKKVNPDFFKRWSPAMAYVLGFFTADGNMMKSRRGNHYISFYNCEKSVIANIKRVMGVEHKIGVKVSTNDNWKDCYSLQIGQKVM